MRLFVAVWPPHEVVHTIAALDRRDVPGLRWTTPDQWHVTLRFLGEADPDDVPPLPDPAGTVATLGPATARLGGHVLMVPVAGLDELAAAVAGPTDRPFRGHLTLARARRGASVPASLAGTPLAVSWPVERVTLVASETHPAGARYTVLRDA